MATIYKLWKQRVFGPRQSRLLFLWGKLVLGKVVLLNYSMAKTSMGSLRRSLTNLNLVSFLYFQNPSNSGIPNNWRVSGTQIPTIYMTEINNNPILLLDTPGFDDSARGNIDVLSDIVSNLHIFTLRQQEIKVRGVIFLYDISENRFAGSQAKTLEILKGLCGNECMGHVIVGTTMWDRNSKKFPKQILREEKFCEKHWKGIHKTIRLFEDDESAASQIILDLLNLPPILLLVQKEMMRPPHTIENTTVGKSTMPDGYREIEELKRQKNAQAEVYENELRRRKADFEEKEQEMRRTANDLFLKAEEENQRLDGERLERQAESQRQYEEVRQEFNEQMKRVAEEADKRELLKREEEAQQRREEAQNRRLEKEKQDRKDEERRRQDFETETQRQKERSETVMAQLVAELERLETALSEMTATPDLTRFEVTINAVVETFGFRPVFEKAVNKSEKLIREAIVVITDQLRAFGGGT